jgi:hypothetical protein
MVEHVWGLFLALNGFLVSMEAYNNIIRLKKDAKLIDTGA